MKILLTSTFGTQALHADWVDTESSQRLLNYQNHTFSDFRQENYDRFKWLRFIIKPSSLLIKVGMKWYLK